MNKHRKESGIPIRVLFSGSIIISMLLLAAVLTLFSYLYSRASLNSQVELSAKQTTLSLEKQIEYVTQTAEQSVILLNHDAIVNQTTLDQRFSRIHLLASMMEMNPILSSIYVGYDDGDFFLLRTLKNSHAKQTLAAPDEASYLIQAIDRNAAGAIIETRWEFFDLQLNSLGSALASQDYAYDPRERPWYQHAQQSNGLILTPPYAFYTTGEVGASFALRNQSAKATVGVDASINDLSQFMGSLQSSSAVHMALVDKDRLILGHNNSDISLVEYDDSNKPTLKKVTDLPNETFAQLLTLPQAQQNLEEFYTDENAWYGMTLPINSFSNQDWLLLYAIPKTELLKGVNQHLINQLLLSTGVILILVLFGLLVGRSISRPLQLLSTEVSKLASFDFSHKIAINSSVKEINVLSSLTDHMALTIHNFQSISHKLAHHPDLESMLAQVSSHLIAITSSRAGAVYLFNKNELTLNIATKASMPIPERINCYSQTWGKLLPELISTLKAEDNSLFLTPLIDRDESILGVLVLQLPEDSHINNETFHNVMTEVSGAAATAITTRRQFEAQQALLDGIIRLLADAIDAKSPYTSGHCERVPELAEMLVDEAIRSQSDELVHFQMNEYERHEFHIAAWLHDCGKITSPVHVVDKATKLETIYNRIHEVRTRFEVLWRDAEIEYLTGLISGQDRQHLEQAKYAQQQRLQEDFAFIATSNIGGEFMDQASLDRLQNMANQSWTRHFSSRIGISQDEQQQLPDTPERLPVREPLLADKIEHIEQWGDRKPAVEAHNSDNIWGFDMDLPERAFNKGELYNLSIQRGTLTKEERFIIKDHMVQTFKMLSSLPFPEELKNVPNIASNHHEQLNGSGYPRKLNAQQLSVQDRILAIADVFEALTASDRPYKVGKTVSESLKILAFMVRDEHLDGPLFKLFVETETYLTYAKTFLKAEQIDAVDHQQLFHWAQIAKN